MGNLKIKTMVLGVVHTNTYIIRNEAVKKAIVIDPADDADKILDYIRTNDLVCEGILLTHGHFDHIMAAEKLAEQLGVKIYAHEAEEKLLSVPELNASAKTGTRISLTPDILLQDGQEIVMADFLIRVIHTPGHTAGGACYHFTGEAVLITGDTLFREEIGRYDLPTANGQELFASIKHKLFVLPLETEVYPGHGVPTMISHEKAHNPYFLNHS